MIITYTAPEACLLLNSYIEILKTGSYIESLHVSLQLNYPPPSSRIPEKSTRFPVHTNVDGGSHVTAVLSENCASNKTHITVESNGFFHKKNPQYKQSLFIVFPFCVVPSDCFLCLTCYTSLFSLSGFSYFSVLV